MAMTAAAITLPVPPSFDWPALVERWVVDDPFQHESEAVEGYYATKAAIANWLEPDSVTEIGVRAGYSAFAFWLGSKYRHYYGYDSDRGEWGGRRGYSKAADALLLSLGVHYCLAIQDTQRLAALVEPVGGIDLAHVDGDHSWAGCKHDVELCLNAGARYVVVDDAIFVPAVKVAAEDVVKQRGLDTVLISDALGRGNLVIANAGIHFPPLPTI